MSNEPESCCFDDWTSFYARRARKGRMGGPSRDLIDALGEVGLQDRTVLDVGCNAGGLVLEILERGARGGTGIDLSAVAIDAARRLAAERGLGGRATFEVADGATAALAPHDVVVLDKVFCCFPDVDALLGNSLGAATSVYAFSVPPSTGLRGAISRARLAVENRWYRLRRRKFGGFRAYVHDVPAIEARVRAAGFERRFARRRFSWDLAVYARA